MSTQIVAGTKIKTRSPGGWTGIVVGVGFVPRGYKVRIMPCAARLEFAEVVFVDWGENILADTLFAWGNPVKVACGYSRNTVEKLEIVP